MTAAKKLEQPTNAQRVVLYDNDLNGGFLPGVEAPLEQAAWLVYACYDPNLAADRLAQPFTYGLIARLTNLATETDEVRKDIGLLFERAERLEVPCLVLAAADDPQVSSLVHPDRGEIQFQSDDYPQDEIISWLGALTQRQGERGRLS